MLALMGLAKLRFRYLLCSSSGGQKCRNKQSKRRTQQFSDAAESYSAKECKEIPMPFRGTGGQQAWYDLMKFVRLGLDMSFRKEREGAICWKKRALASEAETACQERSPFPPRATECHLKNT